MNARCVRRTLLAAALFAPRIAFAESWDPAELAAAEKLRSAEAAHAAVYRARVARGEVRAAAAPMPREAPQKPSDRAVDDARRGEEDLVDLLERWFGGDEEAEPPREPSRDEQRKQQRERRPRDADAWWEEEERRTQGPR